MSKKTIHVVARPNGWVVITEGGEKAASHSHVFKTQKEAVSAARKSIPKQAAQLVVHKRDGLVQSSKLFGLPKIQPAPGKSSLDRKQLEKAVADVMLERLRQ